MKYFLFALSFLCAVSAGAESQEPVAPTAPDINEYYSKPFHKDFKKYIDGDITIENGQTVRWIGPIPNWKWDGEYWRYQENQPLSSIELGLSSDGYVLWRERKSK